MTTRKYNPGFLTDDELVSSFCVRTSEFESIVEMLRECTGSANPHQIVIGPRGSGENEPAAARRRSRCARTPNCSPVSFQSSSMRRDYGIRHRRGVLAGMSVPLSRPSAAQGRCSRPAPNMRRLAYYSGRPDSCRTLSRRSARLLGPGGQAARTDGRESEHDVPRHDGLRSGLAGCARFSRPSRGSSCSPAQLADSTRLTTRTVPYTTCSAVLLLNPLDTDECSVLWEAVVQPILSAPRPFDHWRFSQVVAHVCSSSWPSSVRGVPFANSWPNYSDLVDNHTEYFKSHTESLSAQERRVYLALAELWKPATAKEIAARARLTTSTSSAQLKRLTRTGCRSDRGWYRPAQTVLSDRAPV